MCCRSWSGRHLGARDPEFRAVIQAAADVRDPSSEMTNLLIMDGNGTVSSVGANGEPVLAIQHNQAR